ncbi:linear amide C-N hydrolase [Viridibacillus sp. NPDC093762]|uniref:linear amide C-N hydrolase n=1 Tax=Viridibacillus sp. NPDC093762 TaxID=3390720 RepID=UPI003D01E64E
MSTAFQIKQNGDYFVCKNQDVIYDGVYLFTNQRGVRKTALMMPPTHPASWVSAFGSLTVSQIGKENPNGGINEKGLVVEQTTLWQTEYPASDVRPAINELQWIQYLLDTCSTVQEVLEAAPSIRIDQSTSKLHYLIADRSGNRAIIEFLNGKMTLYKGDLVIPIMVNSPYEEALKEIESGKTNWSDCDEYQKNSMQRLLTVSKRMQENSNHVDVIDFAFEVLNSAKREDTVFSLVYDINRMEVHAYTNRNTERKTIKMVDFDFANGSLSQSVDLQRLRAKNVTEQFETYNTEFNHNAVNSFFRNPTLTAIFKWEISDEMIQFLARYPDSFS